MADTKKSGSRAGAIIAGIAGLSAAAVGAYYLYGHEEAGKNRAKVKSWMLKAKGEVIDELENVRNVTESAYVSAVDTIAKKYRQIKSIDEAELAEFITEMKDHWNGIKRTFDTHTAPAKPLGRKGPRTPRKK
ncbi:MAG TPA: hypothetical protein VHD69_01125 [Candidatus Paceibacterota bacterium]|nr:hypothetical protein [Candidatus Paceibacterota bacterium]